MNDHQDQTAPAAPTRTDTAAGAGHTVWTTPDYDVIETGLEVTAYSLSAR
ncbi:pyrroloquinoline quinone precursor peptide PqqA [Streptomyces sp. NPDC050610]